MKQYTKTLPAVLIFILVCSMAASQVDDPNIYGNESDVDLLPDYSSIIETVSPSDLGITEVTTSNTLVDKIGTDAVFTHETTREKVRKKAQELKQGEGYEEILGFLRNIMNKTKEPLTVERTISVYEISTIYENIDKKAYRSHKTVSLKVDEPYRNITIIEVLPLSLMKNSSELILKNQSALIIQDNPVVIKWHFDVVSEEQEVNFSYYIPTIVVGTEGTEIFAEGTPVNRRIGGNDISGVAGVNEANGNQSIIERGLAELGYQFSQNLIVFSLLFGLVLAIVIVGMEMEGKDMFRNVKNFYRDAEVCARIGLKNWTIIDDYIGDCLDQGYHIEDIRVSLMRAGWNRKAVRTLLKKYR